MFQSALFTLNFKNFLILNFSTNVNGLIIAKSAVNQLFVNGGSNVWSTAQGQERAENFMWILGLNDTIDMLAISSSVYWHRHVLRREDGHVFGKA